MEKTNRDRAHGYYLTQRPPAPGAMPGGFRVMQNYGKKITFSRWPWIKAYGYVEYDHPLTAQQIRDYELVDAEALKKEGAANEETEV